MALKVLEQETVNKMVSGKPVRVTYKLHSKNPQGLRTVRTEYLYNMPLAAGGWLANTITERVVEGVGKSEKTVIPEHRVA